MGWLIWIAAIVIAIAAAIAMARTIAVTTIYAPMVGLDYRNGRFVRTLSPGRYARFDPLKTGKIVPVSTAQYPLHVEASVISSDQFAFKLMLAPVIAVTDPRAYHESQPATDPVYGFMSSGEHPLIRTELAAAAVNAVGTMRLADVLANAADLPGAIMAAVEGKIPGAVFERLLLLAVNLPPETRKAFTDVERAKLEALAAVERARGEQAALRVLANAARSMNDNPALANLRLLKAIETSKGPTTIVLGPMPNSFTQG